MKQLLLFWCIITLATFRIQAQQIDLNESKVTFEVSNLGVNTVDGTITGMTGTINFDPANLANASFKVFIEMSTITTENDARDKHLKNEDFFEIDTYPTISFTSTRVMKDGDNYKVKGFLKIKDVTKEVEIPFQMSNNNGKTTLTGNLEIKRKDYHVGEGTGNFMVGNDIEIAIICVLR